MSRYRVQLFGRFAISASGRGRLSIAGSSAPVLAYLITYRHRHISRIELAETLWAECDSCQARRCLSTALWRIKKATGGGEALFACHGADEVSFNWTVPVWVDSIALESRIKPVLSLKSDDLSSEDVHRLHRGIR